MVQEQSGRTLRYIKAIDLWCRRLAEQSGRTLRLLICGAGSVGEQGGRANGDARVVAEKSWGRQSFCGAGRVAEKSRIKTTACEV